MPDTLEDYFNIHREEALENLCLDNYLIVFERPNGSRVWHLAPNEKAADSRMVQIINEEARRYDYIIYMCGLVRDDELPLIDELNLKVFPRRRAYTTEL